MKKSSLCLLLAALVVPLFSQTRQERLSEHVYYFASDSLHGRAAGSEDAAKAAAYIVNEYESMGLKPLYEDWYMPFMYDKRADIAKKDMKREAERDFKVRNLK